jgi:threonine dehydratase
VSATLADAERARGAIADRVQRTPLVTSHTLGQRIGAEAYLKLENLQRTGSFKVRGALYAMSRLDREARAAGVVTMSAGNAAQAIAYAGRVHGVRVTVVMPAAAPRTKIEATRGYGAEIRFAAEMTQLLPMVQELQGQGLHFLHPFDDDDVIAGHASLGLEILEDVPDVDLVVVPVGGGGLISGVALGIKGRRPAARIVGVQPEGAQAVRKALDAGHSVRLDRVSSVADGLAAPFAGERNLEIIRRAVDDVVVISDEAILDGLRFLVTRARIVPEPAGAAAVAALLAGAVKAPPGARVVAIVSGGNIDADRLAGYLA